MSTRRTELTRTAARLFAEKGYHGTSIGDLAEAMGVQKGSLYAHIESKADLLWEVAREGAAAFHAALDSVPDEGPVLERIRAALRAHLRVVAEQLDVATVFVREWRYLQGPRGEEFVAERRRYEERVRDLFREGVERSALRTDLDVATAALLFLSAANWAYTWLRPAAGTDELADRLYAARLEGVTGLVVAVVGVAALTSAASDPPSHAVAVPGSVGQTTTVSWSGTVPAGSVHNSDCNVARNGTEDAHLLD